MPTNISGSFSYSRIKAKADRYENLIGQAERTNLENNGAPSKAEGLIYLEAMGVCEDIINTNLGSPAIVAKWTTNKKYCMEMSNSILVALGGSVPKHSADSQSGSQLNVSDHTAQSPNVKQTQNGKTETASGFTTRNANQYVSADEIEHWYKPVPNHGLEDLIGMDEVVESLMAVAGNMGFTKTDELLNIQPQKGILLYGFHGNGKTYTLEAFANYLMRKDTGIKFLQLTGGQIKDKFVGVAEKRVEAAFNEAIDNSTGKNRVPCILLFDEIDNVCLDRNTATSSESSLTIAFLEAWNKLVQTNAPVIVVGATNLPWKIDSAVLSRFSAAKISMPLPSAESRSKLIQSKLRNICIEGLTIDEIVEHTENFDYRDLNGLLSDISGRIKLLALKRAAEQNPDFESMSDDEKDNITLELISNGNVKLTHEVFNKAIEHRSASLTPQERAAMEKFEESLRAGA